MNNDNRNLKTEQPALWKKLRAIMVVIVLLGISLALAPERISYVNGNIMQQLLSIRTHGHILMILGLSLIVSGYHWRNNYKLTRVIISIITGYSVMWLLSLIYSAIHNSSSFAVVILWGYFVWTMYDVAKDPGFTLSELIRKTRGKDDE